MADQVADLSLQKLADLSQELTDLGDQMASMSKLLSWSKYQISRSLAISTDLASDGENTLDNSILLFKILP